MMLRVFLVLLVLATSGCFTITTSASGHRNTDDDLWFVRTQTFFMLPIGSTIWYCPAARERGPVACTQATIDEPPDRSSSSSSPPPASPSPPPASAETQSPTPRLPETVSSDVAVRSLDAVTDEVRRCVPRTESVVVRVTFLADGGVGDVMVQQPASEQSAVACIAAAIRRARVPAFAVGTLSIIHQYRARPQF